MKSMSLNTVLLPLTKKLQILIISYMKPYNIYLFEKIVIISALYKIFKCQVVNYLPIFFFSRIEILEKSIGKKAVYNSVMTNLLKPADTNLVNELIYCQEFMNSMKLINESNFDKYNLEHQQNMTKFSIKNNF